jgi:hypothetical protein
MFASTRFLVGSFLIANCAVAAGCATLGPRLVALGAPAEHRLQVPPFLVLTSSPLPEDADVPRQLATLYEQVSRTLALPDCDRCVEVYIFDDRASYDRFIAMNYPELAPRRAFFIAQDDREVVYTFRDERFEEDLRHEACHALIHAVTGTVPLWLDEGLAEYFECPGDAEGVHAQHLLDTKKALGRGWRPDLAHLERLTHVNQMNRDDYRQAWAWVYFLLHGSPQGRELLLSYLAELRDGAPAEPFSRRLREAVPRADAALAAYLANAELRPAPAENDK